MIKWIKHRAKPQRTDFDTFIFSEKIPEDLPEYTLSIAPGYIIMISGEGLYR